MFRAISLRETTCWRNIVLLPNTQPFCEVSPKQHLILLRSDLFLVFVSQDYLQPEESVTFQDQTLMRQNGGCLFASLWDSPISWRGGICS